MKIIFAFLMLGAMQAALPQVKDLPIPSGDTVLEKLGPRLKPIATPSDANLIPAVRQAIELARQTADPRYLGQAQALIGKQWSSPETSHDLLTLQATIEQSRHEFTQAAATLRLALTRAAPSHAQAKLTLATIERVQGNYAAAQAACKSINEPPAQLYARACLLETISMQGQWAGARDGFAQLLREQRLPVQQAWLQSLLAENELRAGDNAAALKYFAISLSLADDGYTALAFADALLDSGQAQQALQTLRNQPSSDSVLIRQAQAYKMLRDERYKTIAQELAQRFTAAQLRGSAQAQAHSREQALFELQVQGNPQAALAFALSNLKLQKESVDWLLALRSARAAGNSVAASDVLKAAAQTGLKDARLK
jgi:tetratricopeptide (TPR) repeat protein